MNVENNASAPVKVRVQCHRYGLAADRPFAFMGDVIEVPQSEVLATRQARYGGDGYPDGTYYYPLLPLDMERSQQAEVVKPASGRAEAERARARAAALAASDKALLERRAREGLDRKPEDAVSAAAQAVASAVQSMLEKKGR